MKVSNFIVFFGTGIIGLAWLIGIFYLQKSKPVYYKYIFTFILLGLLISTNTIVNSNNFLILTKKELILIQDVLVLFQYSMLGLFFIALLNKSLYLKKIVLLFILSLLIHITLIIVVLSTNTEIKPSISSTLFLLIFCFFYVRDLMNNKPTLILVRSAAFWIVMGIFFYSCISVPVNSLIPFIPKNPEYIILRSQIFSIYNVSLIVLYIFIIKSYLCLRHPQNL